MKDDSKINAKGRRCCEDGITECLFMFALIAITMIVIASTMNSFMLVDGQLIYNDTSSTNTTSSKITNATSQQSIPGEFSTYDNQTYGVTIQYPSGWDKEPGVETSLVDVVTFNIPNNVGTITIWIEKLEKNATVEDFLFGQTYSSCSGEHPNVIESTTNITFANKPGFKILCNYGIDDSRYELMMIGAIANNKAYHIVYEVEEEYYSLYLPIVQKMIDSFEITSEEGSIISIFKDQDRRHMPS